MSLESEDKSLLDQATDHGLEKKKIIVYTREFLLSLSGLDICKELPSGFDRSLLSEFEDAPQELQRSTGGLSMHSFRRNEYGSSPPTRNDMNSFSRGGPGKWETRSSGRSDRDSDSQSEWDSDSGKRSGNPSRRSWQGPEHDGLLGSGSFPRPSGSLPGSGLPAPKFRTNDSYQLNRSNEPYHPPRPYKAPHSRRETNDSFNDETFGSSENASEDREEEERKRRASFELMRKEQQKTFQEKNKLNPGKNKDEFDITSLLDDDQKRLISRSDEPVEPPDTLPVLSNDEKNSSISHTPLVARPLVPPGFAISKLERNLVPKTSSNTHATEVGQSEPEDTKHVFNINSENIEGTLSTKEPDNDQHSHRIKNLNVSISGEKEKILNFSSDVDIPAINVAMGDQARKISPLSEALETPEDKEFIQLNAEVKGKETISAFNHDNSNSILFKFFGSTSTLNSGKSTSIIEPDQKADEAWSPHAFQSSKFAHWFVEEEKKPVDDLIQRPNDLLSLIVGCEKGGLQMPDAETIQQIALALPLQNLEPAPEHPKSNVPHATIDNSEQAYKSDKPEVAPAVLTCEDLEQSILSQVSENGSSSKHPMQDTDFDVNNEKPTSSIDNQASQHLLSLLQKGTSHKDKELSSILDSTDKVLNSEGAITGNIIDKPGEANGDVSSSSKTLTLETLFGKAFMKELQSVNAPVSVQRGSIGSTGADVSESVLFSFPTSDNVHPNTGELALSRHGSGVPLSDKTHQPKSRRFEEQWLGYGDFQGDVIPSLLQSEVPKLGGFNGPHDIHLPEEDNMISRGDPLQNFLSTGNLAKTDLSQGTSVDITRKLAALNPAFRDQQLIMRNQEGPAYPPGPYDMREPGLQYQNLNVQRPHQLNPPQLNHMGPMFYQMESHSPHMSSYMKLGTPEGMVRHNSPPNHHFPGNMLRPPFHQPNSGMTGFDSPAHHSMLQQMHMQGGLPPPHLLRGFPRGTPPPPHPSNPISGLMQESNPMQSFPPFGGHQHPHFGGPGMPLQAAEVGGGRNHPEALQRLFEMELRSNSKPIHASGHSQGMYGQGQELDLGLGYR